MSTTIFLFMFAGLLLFSSNGVTAGRYETATFAGGGGPGVADDDEVPF